MSDDGRDGQQSISNEQTRQDYVWRSSKTVKFVERPENEVAAKKGCDGHWITWKFIMIIDSVFVKLRPSRQSLEVPFIRSL